MQSKLLSLALLAFGQGRDQLESFAELRHSLRHGGLRGGFPAGLPPMQEGALDQSGLSAMPGNQLRLWLR